MIATRLVCEVRKGLQNKGKRGELVIELPACHRLKHSFVPFSRIPWLVHVVPEKVK